MQTAIPIYFTFAPSDFASLEPGRYSVKVYESIILSCFTPCFCSICFTTKIVSVFRYPYLILYIGLDFLILMSTLFSLSFSLPLSLWHHVHCSMFSQRFVLAAVWWQKLCRCWCTCVEQSVLSYLRCDVCCDQFKQLFKTFLLGSLSAVACCDYRLHWHPKCFY